MSPPVILKVFSDYICPWCYLADNRIKKLKRNYKITIELVHFPLHPETPPEGKTLLELFGGTPEDIKIKNTQMKEQMEAEGLPFSSERSHTYNSRLAQEIGAWADSVSEDNQIHDRFFEAYFVNRLNISDIDVIIDIVNSIGLDGSEARRIISKRRYKNIIDENWKMSWILLFQFPMKWILQRKNV